MTDTTQTPDDEFAAAFAELQVPASSSTPTAAAAPSAPAEAAVPPSATAPAGTEAPAPAAAVPSGEAGNGSGTSAEATPAASAEVPTSTAAQPAATPASEATPAPDLAAQFAALQAELAEFRKNPAAAAPAPAPTPTPAAPPPTYTADEQTAVDTYLKEWGDVAKGEALLRRAEYQQLVGFMMEQFRPRIEALESQTSTVSTRTQYQDLVTLVPDYDAVRDATLAWIETQPDYLKTAYQNVASQGSAKDVADLITRFKKETNYVAPAAATAAAAPAAAPAAPAAAAPAGGLAPAAAAAAASLRVVKSSRSEPVSTPDPNDFDAAFKEFAANA